jgi:hypothetical protein
MTHLFRWSVGAGLLAALLTSGSDACPTWSARVGLNLREWLRVRLQLEEELRREEILDRQAQRIMQCLEGKTWVVEDLGAHRLTLLEAAARFRDLSDTAPGCYLEWSRRHDPGQTDEERWCRQVIRFVRGHYPERPSLPDEFEAELAEHLARGPLHLLDEPTAK